MVLNGEKSRLEPNDFANFVYCGLKWLLDKTTRYGYKHETPKRNHIRIGIQNEDKCVEFIVDQLKATSEEILYIGTNNSNVSSVPLEIEQLGIKMQSKPDLIVKYKNRTRLFEFKALGDPKSLFKPEFNANHAQIWCYTHLVDFKIDDYYLFRYFMDPLIPVHIENFRHPVKSYKNKSLKDELDDSIFLNLFRAYARMNKVLNRMKRKEIVKLIEDLKAFSPMCEYDKKCKSCIHKFFNRCPAHTAI